MTILRDREKQIVIVLCLAAAIRVLTFSLSFPFFNNIDEELHFDLVKHYAYSGMPTSLSPYSQNTIEQILIYRSPEYIKPPSAFVGGEYPTPVWARSSPEPRDIWAFKQRFWNNSRNPESLSPPLYYLVASIWYRLGALALDPDGGYILYWTRSLNALIVAVAVWSGYAVARAIFPGRRSIAVIAAILIASFPQDAFYGIQSDTLSPLCFAIAFFFTIRFCGEDPPKFTTGFAAGFAIAATVLTKTANLPLLAAALGILGFKVTHMIATRRLRAITPGTAWLIFGMCLPIGAWLTRNYFLCGDLTASKAKIATLGWTTKPFNQWLQHPIFTIEGFGTFYSKLVASFWRGELIWHGELLSSSSMDRFYWISTLVLSVLCLKSLFSASTSVSGQQRLALWFAVLSVFLSIIFSAFLSIVFDFGDCHYPSRANPYFVSGRLLSGMLIPFMLLYAWALDTSLSWIKNPSLRWFFIGAIASAITLSTIAVNGVAFFSKYNFFHL
jgi:hypothetical protein